MNCTVITPLCYCSNRLLFTLFHFKWAKHIKPNLSFSVNRQCFVEVSGHASCWVLHFSMPSLSNPSTFSLRFYEPRYNSLYSLLNCQLKQAGRAAHSSSRVLLCPPRNFSIHYPKNCQKMIRKIREPWNGAVWKYVWKIKWRVHLHETLSKHAVVI